MIAPAEAEAITAELVAVGLEREAQAFDAIARAVAAAADVSTAAIGLREGGASYLDVMAFVLPTQEAANLLWRVFHGALEAHVLKAPAGANEARATACERALHYVSGCTKHLSALLETVTDDPTVS